MNQLSYSPPEADTVVLNDPDMNLKSMIASNKNESKKEEDL